MTPPGSARAPPVAAPLPAAGHPAADVPASWPSTASLYRQALAAADTAYDRTLLASAKAIGELLERGRPTGWRHAEAGLPYSALEAFEADNRSRLYYRVSGFKGEMVSGFDDLPPPRAAGRRQPRLRRAGATSTTTPTVASRCAWPCCCSRWPAPTARAWP
jgi:hypothetical protein